MLVCRWHRALIDPDTAVLVGAIERGSGAPLALYACPTCTTVHDLLPLIEHPSDSNGLPMHRSGQLVVGGPNVEVLDRTALRAYVNHTGDCGACSRRLFNCDRGRALWDAYTDARKLCSA